MHYSLTAIISLFCLMLPSILIITLFLSTSSNQRGSNEPTTTRYDIQPITSQRTCQIELIRKREDYPIENLHSTRQDFSIWVKRQITVSVDHKD